MERDFGVKPKSEHYACMIDLLGRAGQLNQALEFIERMPVKPDAGVWGRYVLLSNIYASLGKRKEAYKIRNLMKSRGVKKIVGRTSIEIKGYIYTFVSEDRLNPETELIYLELGKLMERIRQGYVPDLNFALHDVKETREMMLYAHSEKLAIVFGLIKSGHESSIRITKNLRVWGLSHCYKVHFQGYRKGNCGERFHHFVNGTYSCADYW
ncbi:pentatricopeptide repeat-containing protein At2g01510, mitochondrial-like [Hibiscus syriacus]|uniref:pentatricopeptide repeat-containing protein At2g01510, mitochondrial-like n=1 Tax=Hibiscus syriacus TaxID=106335 RepID=UPI001920423C|nr:pentatricopeptide repeat-containing protein At2g01510, mitochondrial-like [Hibiscus syriacus]